MSGANPSSRPLIKSSILAPSRLASPAASNESGSTSTTTGGGGGSTVFGGGGKSNNPFQSKSVFTATSGVSAASKFGGFKESKLSGIVKPTDDKKDEETAKTEDQTTTTNSTSATPATTTRFLPLGSKEATLTTTKASESKTSESEKQTSTNSSSTNYVFGQNLTDKVANFQNASSDKGKAAEADKKENEEDKAKESSTEKADESKKSAEQSETSSNANSKKTLSEAAAEYQEAHAAVKRKYEEVTPVTGEENEKNILQISVAKLYVFDSSNSSWIERGRGALRLNDGQRQEDGEAESRLVMRAVGTQRVTLNTKVYSGMTLERPSEKTIRLTAPDVCPSEDSASAAGGIRVFLLSGPPKEMAKLYGEMTKRKDVLDAKATKNGGGETKAAETSSDDQAKKAKTEEGE